MRRPGDSLVLMLAIIVLGATGSRDPAGRRCLDDIRAVVAVVRAARGWPRPWPRTCDAIVRNGGEEIDHADVSRYGSSSRSPALVLAASAAPAEERKAGPTTPRTRTLPDKRFQVDQKMGMPDYVRQQGNKAPPAARQRKP